ncbi:MAG: P1 family peptidase [Solobacterium sp.]|nr:P1 family peptidase [Solobacterium sp.]
MKEIRITDIKPLRIGQCENAEAATGLTVLICENEMTAGLDVRGGGPASRDSQLLNPLMAIQKIHAVVLSGGSAFGLGAANGVMACLEERGYGYSTVAAKVPLVVQSDIYDLSVGDASVRPDSAMGWEVARRALDDPNYRDGNYGAGCGATVGKIAGMTYAMKTGIGSYAVQIGDLQIGAVAVVNALGDIIDPKTGRQIAGLLDESRTGLRSTLDYMSRSIAVKENKFVDNTTIAAIVTNASFSKAQLCKIAGMGHDGFARTINPVHTSADGDSIYALSVGDVTADMDLVGALGADVLSQAVLRAVSAAESAYGYPSAADLGFLG